MKKIFVCWSGSQGKALASLLKEWLSSLLENKVDLFFSEDIEKGVNWFEILSTELSSADAGLICLTREGLDSNWLHFEAGALFKSLKADKNRIYTYLFGIDQKELNSPLTKFQLTYATSQDTLKLVLDIIGYLDEELDQMVSVKIRENWESIWQEFDWKLRSIKHQAIEQLIPALTQLSKLRVFNEVPDKFDTQNWLDYYSELTLALDKLRSYSLEDDPKASKKYYTELLNSLESFRSSSRALLLTPNKGGLTEATKISETEQNITRWEERRKKFNFLFSHLTNSAPPVFEASISFAIVSTFEAKKILIHDKEKELKNNILKVSSDYTLQNPQMISEAVTKCQSSHWDLDRVIYYLFQELENTCELSELQFFISNEFEKLRAKTEQESLIPLYYSLRVLKKRLENRSEGLTVAKTTSGNIQKLLSEISIYLKKDLERTNKDRTVKIIAELKRLFKMV